MLESQFQSKLIKEIKKKYPGCVVLKTDPNYIQGFPDLLILNGRTWAAIECKKSATANHRPNQNYWVKRLHQMSFAKFIWPENKEEVLNAMDRSFKGFSKRESRALLTKSTGMEK
jgi:hypothetical protein